MTDEKILIIEDEKKISDIVKSYLEREGFRVSVAPTGESALSQIKEGFDLIILDLMLPDIDGETICTSLREFSDVPIIMLTHKAKESSINKALSRIDKLAIIKPPTQMIRIGDL